MTSGRKPIGEKPMTAAERKRRQRAIAQEQGIPTRDQVVAAFGRALIDLAPKIQNTSLYEQIEDRINDHLSKLGFKRRPIQNTLQQVKEGVGTD